MSHDAIRESEGFIFDLDGTLYRGDRALPYAAEAVAIVRSRAKKAAFLTNSALYHRSFYAQKLTDMGIPATAEEIMTSAYGTALWLKDNPHGSPLAAHVVGEEGLVRELTEVGVETKNVSPVEFVVVGLDRKFTCQKLWEARQAILKGARFIATNADPQFPTEQGMVPGAGSIVEAVARATGVSPTVIGKPSAYLVRYFLQQWGLEPRRCLLVGDSLRSDVAAARAAGVKNALVLTGVSQEKDLKTAGPCEQPDLVLEDMGHFCRLIRDD